MEKLKLAITKQLGRNPSAQAQVKDRLGTNGFDSTLRVSDACTLELLEAGAIDIAIIRNAVAYEALKIGRICDPNLPKVPLASTGIDSGMKLFWSAAFGDYIWENGLREPRLCTPFPNAMRADMEIANAREKRPAPIPMMYQINEGLSKIQIDQIRGDLSCDDISWAGCPAFFGNFTPEEVSGNWPTWNVGEWKPGTGSPLSLTEYGLWGSARAKKLLDDSEKSGDNKELAEFIRNFNL